MTYTHPLQADIRLERQDGKDYFSFHILSYFVSVDMIWFADKLFFNISLFCNSPAHVYNSISADFQLIIQLINESFIVPSNEKMQRNIFVELELVLWWVWKCAQFP